MSLILLTLISSASATLTIAGTQTSTDKTINLGNEKITGGGTTNNYYNISGGNISGDGTANYICGYKSQNVIEGVFPLQYTSTLINLIGQSDTIGEPLFYIKNDGGGNTVEVWDVYGSKMISGSIIPKYSLSIEKYLGNSTHPFNYTYTENLWVRNRFNSTTITSNQFYSDGKIKVESANDDGSVILEVTGDGGANKAFNVTNAGDVGVADTVTASYFVGDGSGLTNIAGINRTFNQTLTDSLYVPDSNNGITTMQAGQLVVNLNSTNDASITFSTYDLFGDGSILLPKITPYSSSLGSKMGYIESGLYMLSTEALVTPTLTYQNDVTAKSGSLSLSSDGRLVIETFSNVTAYIPIYASNFGGEGNKLTNLTHISNPCSSLTAEGDICYNSTAKGHYGKNSTGLYRLY